jgi:hypothetical protein
MRPGGKDGKLYRIVYGDPVNGGSSATITTEGFYKIASKAESGSGIPQPSTAMTAKGALPLAAGNIYWARSGQTLAAGDTVVPLTLKLISFVTDVQDSSQRQSHDVTTQADIESGNRSYLPGAFQERTGTINGVVDVDSEEQTELWNEYREIVADDGTNIGRYPARSVEHEYMMGRQESSGAGETAVWEYMPLISESIQAPKPMDGVQSFSFNYRVDGKRKPQMIRKEGA